MADTNKIAEMYVEIRAKTDKLQSDLEDIKNNVGKIGKETDSTSTKLSKWGNIATGINQSVETIRRAFTDLKNVFKDSVLASNQLNVLRDNFKGTSNDIELFRKATAGTVSEANLIKLSNQATDLGISLQNQALLFALAEDAADKYGTSTEEGFNKIVLATEGSAKGLKALGIQKAEYEKLVEESAKAHGDTIDNLDAETQKQIRLEAIIKLTGITLEDVNNKVKDNADKYEALSVRVEEAKVEIGNLISNALMPVIDAFDGSGKGAKTFISSIIAIGSTILQLIPLIVQLKNAQALMATTTVATTTAITAQSAALGANAIATTGWLAKVMSGLKLFGLASVGVLIGVISGEIIDYFRDTLPNQINEESKKAADKLRTKVPTFGNKRTIVENGKVKTVSIKETLPPSSDTQALIDQLDAYDETIKNATKDLENFTEGTKEHKAAEIVLANAIDQKNAALEKSIDTSEKEVDIIHEISDATTKQFEDLDLLNTAIDQQRAKLNTLDKANEDYAVQEKILSELEEKRKRILQDLNPKLAEQEQLNDRIKESLPTSQYIELQKELSALFRQLEEKENIKVKTILDEKDIEYLKKRISETFKEMGDIRVKIKAEKGDGFGNDITSAIENASKSFNAKRAGGEVEPLVPSGNDLNSYIQEAKQKRTQLEEDIADIQRRLLTETDEFERELLKKRLEDSNNELNDLKGLKEISFSEVVSDMEQMSNMAVNISNSFDFAGKTFVQSLSQAFSIVSGIIGIVTGIIKIASGGGIFSWFGGGASAAGPAHFGGTFANGKKISSVPEFANGGSFIVPPGFPNDGFNMRVESGEKVSVTPRSAVTNNNTDALLSKLIASVQAMNMNLVQKQMVVNIKSDVDALGFVKGVVKPGENRFLRNGYDSREIK